MIGHAPEEDPRESTGGEARRGVAKVSARTRLWVGIAVVVLLGGVLLAKLSGAGDAPSRDFRITPPGRYATPTSKRNDALADYDSALKSGKPIYVLFHSRS